MAKARYLVSIGSEDGPLLTSPMGGVLTWEHYDDAAEAAQRGPRGQTRWIHATQPLAVYTSKTDSVVSSEESEMLYGSYQAAG